MIKDTINVGNNLWKKTETLVGFQETAVRIWRKIAGLTLTAASIERDKRYPLFEPDPTPKQSRAISLIATMRGHPLPPALVSVVFTAAPAVVPRGISMFVLSPPRRGTTTDKDRMTHGIIGRTRRDTYRLLITTPSYRRVGLRDAASRRYVAAA